MHKEVSDLQRVQIQLLDGGVDREPLGEHELGVDPVHGCHQWSQGVTGHIATNKAPGDDTPLTIAVNIARWGRPRQQAESADTRGGESCVCWAELTHIVTSRQNSVASKALLSFKQIVLTSNM